MIPHLAGTPVLETERLILRAPAPQDYPMWEAFFLSPRGAFIGGGPDFDAGRAWRAFAALIGHWALRGFGLFAMIDRNTGEAVGGCGPWYPELWPEREIGWSLWRAEAEGTGLMTEAGRAVLAHAFDDLGWDTAVSYIEPRNSRSSALARRLGARPDPGARTPGGDATVQVYRHPRPERHA